MRVVVDTCVWVASVRSRRGASFALLSEISHSRFQFGISVPLFNEYREKLHDAVARGHTALSEIQMDSILSALAFYGVEVPIYFRRYMRWSAKLYLSIRVSVAFSDDTDSGT